MLDIVFGPLVRRPHQPTLPRFFQLLPLLAALSACGPRTLPPTDRPEFRPVANIATTGPSGPPAERARERRSIEIFLNHPDVALTTHRTKLNGLKLTTLTFDARRFTLRVLDKENGPDSTPTTSRAAAAELEGIAAINGGFFTPEGTPLGLVMENGQRYGHLSRSSLGSGVFVGASAGVFPELLRRQEWSASKPASRDLLQSGPFLLESGKTVPGLSSSRPRERSFLLWDGGAGWALGHSSSTTLAELSRSLSTQPVPGFRIHHALNLDGGTSSDLWIAPSVKGGPVSQRRLWNKKVRNYLVLTPISS